MSDFIPFVNSKKDCSILKEIYPKTSIIRITLCASEGVKKSLPAGPRFWVDSAVDIFHDKWPREPRREHLAFEKYDESGVFRDLAGRKPSKQEVWNLAEHLLDDCQELKPSWLSVPQLPYDKDKKRTTLNRHLAQATASWASKNRFAGTLIVPVILTHRDQVIKKPQRDRIIRLVSRNLDDSGARGVWIVDANLNDQSGAGTNQERFLKLLEFHRDLQAALPNDTHIIAGPYWGMNLVVWARGMATHSAIGLGSSFQYRFSGGASLGGSPSVRVALPVLRRQAKVNASLEKWLDATIGAFPDGSVTRNELESIRERFNVLQAQGDKARWQIAQFYKSWIDLLARAPVAGRSLALYQDLSNAYVVGKEIESTLNQEGTARRPERIAQQLMLSCL